MSSNRLKKSEEFVVFADRAPLHGFGASALQKAKPETGIHLWQGCHGPSRHTAHSGASLRYSAVTTGRFKPPAKAALPADATVDDPAEKRLWNAGAARAVDGRSRRPLRRTAWQVY